jgi:hypothetical protein
MAVVGMGADLFLPPWQIVISLWASVNRMGDPDMVENRLRHRHGCH